MKSKVVLSTILEYSNYSKNLHQLGIFPYISLSAESEIKRLIVFFRFKSIQFNKKRTLPFFLAIELITNRKSIASLAKKNMQILNLRKKNLVGCKVTLRKMDLSIFLDILLRSRSRMDKFQPTQLFLFNLKKNLYNKHNNESSYALHLTQLILFYPIEYSLGIHPDVQTINIKFIFSTLSIEERFFLLRYYKIPILN